MLQAKSYICVPVAVMILYKEEMKEIMQFCHLFYNMMVEKQVKVADELPKLFI